LAAGAFAAFLAAGFFAAFLAAGFFATFLAAAFLAGAFLAGAFLAGAFLATTFFAGAFLAGAFLAVTFLAATFLAATFLAGAFFAGAFLATTAGYFAVARVCSYLRCKEHFAFGVRKAIRGVGSVNDPTQHCEHLSNAQRAFCGAAVGHRNFKKHNREFSFVSTRPDQKLVPRQSATRLVLNHARFKEVTFLLEVNHFAHPRKRVFFIREKCF
jgi:hypothetical protein